MPLVYPIKNDGRHHHATPADYDLLYAQSITDPDKFWGEIGKRLTWSKPYSRVKNTSYNLKDFHIKWYEDGALNVCVNCVDRHLPKRANQVALIWESNDPNQDKKITYQELYDHVCRLANALRQDGVKKGDRITIYMPMIPEAIYAMLAVARIGAIHSVVFAGFSPESLAGRILDGRSTYVITANEGVRGAATVALKKNVDVALDRCQADGHQVAHVLVVKRNNGAVAMKEGRDRWYHDTVPNQSTTCPPETMNAEDPLFILYTSGSTGKPKGVLHTSGGYLVYASYTHQMIFDYHDGDIYWCSADIGWVTGHSYIVYGPLANGATTLVFEGVPNYPDASRFWQVIDKHKVNIFYTAPTAIRALMREGEAMVKKTSRQSLRILGTVGEPINPEAWRWYYQVVGNERCPIVDTWWQTETGATLISPLPYAIPQKPGSASKPFFGIRPLLVDDKGREVTTADENGMVRGNLCLADSWPGQMRTVYGDHERFIKTYFTQFPGLYCTGDGAGRDQDGYYWITGRVDDVLNISGHRLGTAEIESAMVQNHKVAEAAVVGFDHPIKGSGIYVFVTLKNSITVKDSAERDQLIQELKATVRKEIGPIATPDVVQLTGAGGLPKTRSGKIMRRILRKIAAG
ncbi:MAG: acetate--CoA ligase, partial [Alphaproteobacteria bacterium]|nr:acetate--CoA ligase [Alphaproteobacteria bacterium]